MLPERLFNMTCLACNSKSTLPWSLRYWSIPGIENQFRYLVCSDCGTIFCNPMPSSEELTAFYRDHFNYSWYQERMQLKKVQAFHRWRCVTALFKKYAIPKGRYLEVGCGHGLLLSHAAASGWEAVGVDYPSLATRHARELLGLTVVEDDLRSAIQNGGLLSSYFDFITAWHCLEHDIEPLAYLEGLYKLLAPGGKVLLVVPNAEALGMKVMKERWVWCQQPYVHVFHYTGKSLSLLADRAGMNVLATWTRDTWDAHPAFDIHAEARVITISSKLQRYSRRAAFWFEEGMRLISYALTCPNQWLFGQERTDGQGSELLLLAERKR